MCVKVTFCAVVVVQTTYVHLIRRQSFPVSFAGENIKSMDTFNFGVVFCDLPFYSQVQGLAELGDC